MNCNYKRDSTTSVENLAHLGAQVNFIVVPPTIQGSFCAISSIKHDPPYAFGINSQW